MCPGEAAGDKDAKGAGKTEKKSDKGKEKGDKGKGEKGDKGEKGKAEEGGKEKAKKEEKQDKADKQEKQAAFDGAFVATAKAKEKERDSTELPFVRAVLFLRLEALIQGRARVRPAVLQFMVRVLLLCRMSLSQINVG